MATGHEGVDAAELRQVARAADLAANRLLSMGWYEESAPGHEGVVANVLRDGRATASSVSGGVVVTSAIEQDIADRREVRRFTDSDAVEVIVPWEAVSSWQVRCTYGWTGSSLAATGVDGLDRECPDSIADTIFYSQWRGHLAPVPGW